MPDINFFFFSLKTGSCVAQVGLELALHLRMTVDYGSSCFCLLSVRRAGIHTEKAHVLSLGQTRQAVFLHGRKNKENVKRKKNSQLSTHSQNAVTNTKSLGALKNEVKGKVDMVEKREWLSLLSDLLQQGS